MRQELEDCKLYEAFLLVGVRGFEPPTSASQTLRASQLRYTPLSMQYIKEIPRGQPSQVSLRCNYLPFGRIQFVLSVWKRGDSISQIDCIPFLENHIRITYNKSNS